MFLAGAVVGLLDDWMKERFRNSLAGLDRKAKSLLQLAFILPFAAWFVSPWSPVPETLRTTLQFPFFKSLGWNIGPLLFAAFMVLALYAMINAVNLADGKDGLVAGPGMMTAGIYALFAFLLGDPIQAKALLFIPIPGASELAVFGAALAGGLAGFLWFNAYPAEIFMGDTGSLAIGAALGTMAFLTRQEILFLIVGGIFVLSSFTSLVQIIATERFHRRVFVRAPLHDSWQIRGISEPKGVIRYWLVSLVLSIIAALSIKLR